MNDRGIKYVDYLQNSSFPYTLELEGQSDEIRSYLEGLYNTIVVEDIINHSKISEPMMLKSILKFIFDNIGNPLSSKKIADTMTSSGRRIDTRTVEKYLNALTESYIIYQAKRYNIKGKQYLKKMGGIIMVASIIIWFLGYYPNHEAYETTAEQQENSYIGQLGKAIEPAIEPLGFDWKMGIGILSGIGAKELVVSTLGVLYTNEDDVDSVDLSERIPITPLVAYGYMLFVLIYFPCIATLAAIKQESGGWKWAIFAATYTTVLAWIVSFGVYQIGSLFI